MPICGEPATIDDKTYKTMIHMSVSACVYCWVLGSKCLMRLWPKYGLIDFRLWATQCHDGGSANRCWVLTACSFLWLFDFRSTYYVFTYSWMCGSVAESSAVEWLTHLLNMYKCEPIARCPYGEPSLHSHIRTHVGLFGRGEMKRNKVPMHKMILFVFAVEHTGIQSCLCVGVGGCVGGRA